MHSNESAQNPEVHDEALWPEDDVMEEATFARRYSDRDAPKRRHRRPRPTARRVLRAVGKVLLFLLVSVLAAVLVCSVVYMIGSHTPLADMPRALGNFFARVFSAIFSG